MTNTTLTIKHDESNGRFEARVDGYACVLEYQLRDGTMIIQHTGVPGAVGGRGIAAALTRHALDTARARRWRVLPLCSYAVTYIARHTEYQDLVA
ncbi:GNAT family N-acetyltransferase [Bordetella sp. 02P26C-1]|uniref:GNAT family N-acetyltransferase n=1 Tax=Bordetella sp. 02P26C-1 TaxID=2683195 RepID=UPI001352D0AC|nr:GNAT family N-acetyltransferase [Bordetella sp. 02P26C-1]MVW80221.1 N-acetyltransferase [Bordetella sp. 02P26C-1]